MDDLTIPAFLDRRPLVGNYTMLNTIKNICEHQGWRRFIKKDIPYQETEAMRWGTEVHAAFAKRIGKRQPLPGHMLQWEKHATPFDNYEVIVEQKLGITSGCHPTGFFDNDVYFRGLADAAVIVNDKALMTDWKTGSSRFEDPFELATGALLLKSKYPNLRTVVGRYIYLKEDKIGQMHDLSNFKATWDEINDLMDLIAEKRKSGEWVKKKSGLCGWCSVEDCENHFVARP
jgi:hypothetical protein